MTKLIPIKGALPGELQVRPAPPERLTGQKMSREIREMAYASLRMLGGVNALRDLYAKDPGTYFRFVGSTLVRDNDDGAAGVTIVVQQIVQEPSPTRGVGGSPIVGDVQVV